MAELAEQREVMLAERRRRDRAAAWLLTALILAAAATHGAAIYLGMRLERAFAKPIVLPAPPIAKPANQVLGCSEVLRICRAEYSRRRSGP